MPTFCLQCLRLMALGFLALGLISPWYQLPVNGSEGELVSSQPPSVLLFKAITVIVLAIASVATAKRAFYQPSAAVKNAPNTCARRQPLVLAVSGLVGFLLFFPFATMIWSPSTGARATELATSHDTLTWLGGDVYNAQEYEAVANKGSEILKGAPRAIAITPDLESLPTSLALGKLDEIFEWAGYTPAFSEFVKKGWLCTLCGLALLAVSLLRVGFFAHRRKGDYGIARGAGKTFAAVATLGAAVVLITVHLSAKALDRARIASAEGNAERALRALNSAARWFPANAYSTDLVRQRGKLAAGLKQDNEYAALQQAIGLETLGFEARAERAFHDLLDRTDAHPAVLAEARRGLMRFAVHDLNSGQTDRALATMQRLHDEDAASPRLNYAMQVATLRLGRDSELENLVTKMESAYSFYQSPNKRAGLSAAQRHLALAALERDDAIAAAFHNSKSRRP